MPLFLCDANGTQLYPVSGGGWFSLPNGDVACPAVSGYVHPAKGWTIVELDAPPQEPMPKPGAEPDNTLSPGEVDEVLANL